MFADDLSDASEDSQMTRSEVSRDREGHSRALSYGGAVVGEGERDNGIGQVVKKRAPPPPPPSRSTKPAPPPLPAKRGI